MRILILTGMCLLNALLPMLSLHAQDDIRPIFVNVKTSSTKISLNEAVRIEFTTMPRDIEGVDIAASVANSLRLGDGANWRLLTPPVITESAAGPSHHTVTADPTKPPVATHERPKPVTVVFTVLPRMVGDLPLPNIAITWLAGNPVAQLPVIAVDASIKVGTTKQELPKEVSGVAGIPWNAKLAEVKANVPPGNVEAVHGNVVIKLEPNLLLTFTGEVLSGATLMAPKLSLDEARVEFLKHWGIPQIEDATSLTWILGWTRITATQEPANGGVTIQLQREDVLANIAHGLVANDVFNVLDSPTVDTPEQAAKRRAGEAADTLDHPATIVPVPAHP